MANLPDPGTDLDPVTLVGLLADPDRRAVFAALVLGADSIDEISARSGLPPARAAGALARLSSAGLVISLDGSPHLLAEAFAVAARRARMAEAQAEPEAGALGRSRDAAKVFAAFVRDGRITQIPAAHGKRQVLLDWLAQDFELGKRYSESMVNLILGKRHPDTAAWRRYLVDEEFLSREAGEYWRSGGSVGAPDS